MLVKDQATIWRLHHAIPFKLISCFEREAVCYIHRSPHWLAQTSGWRQPADAFNKLLWRRAHLFLQLTPPASLTSTVLHHLMRLVFQIHHPTLFKSIFSRTLCCCRQKCFIKKTNEWVPAGTETWGVELFMCSCYLFSSHQPFCSQSGWLVKHVWVETFWALINRCEKDVLDLEVSPVRWAFMDCCCI